MQTKNQCRNPFSHNREFTRDVTQSISQCATPLTKATFHPKKSNTKEYVATCALSHQFDLDLPIAILSDWQTKSPNQ